MATLRSKGDGGTAVRTFTAKFQLLAGWEGVHDHAGKALPHSAEQAGRLADIPYFRRAVIDTYVRWSAGLGEKNSTTPPAAD